MGAPRRAPCSPPPARAGQGHAAVLVTPSLGTILLTSAARLSGTIGHLARWGVPLAAILTLFSALGTARTEPGALRRQ